MCAWSVRHGYSHSFSLKSVKQLSKQESTTEDRGADIRACLASGCICEGVIKAHALSGEIPTRTLTDEKSKLAVQKVAAQR